MASKAYMELRRLGFSDRFLRTTAGNHPNIRAVILNRQDLWQPCRSCQELFVLTTRLESPVFNKHGRDVRGAARPFHKTGFCSSHCAADRLGDDVHIKTRSMLFASRKDFYRTEEWRRLRYRALSLYGNRCACCGRTPRDGAIMHVDHITPKSWRPELALDITNLQVLCDQCNLGKGATDNKRWRDAG